MRAIVVEFAGADDRDTVEGRARDADRRQPDGRPVSRRAPATPTARADAGRPPVRRAEGEPGRTVERRSARGQRSSSAIRSRRSRNAWTWSVAGRPSSSRGDVEDVAQVGGRASRPVTQDLRRSPPRSHRAGRSDRPPPKRSARSLARISGVPATIRATPRAPSSAAGPSRARRRATAPRRRVRSYRARSPRDRPRSRRHRRADRGTGRPGRPGSRSRSAGRSRPPPGRTRPGPWRRARPSGASPVRSSVNSRRASARSLT